MEDMDQPIIINFKECNHTTLCSGLDLQTNDVTQNLNIIFWKLEGGKSKQFKLRIMDDYRSLSVYD